MRYLLLISFLHLLSVEAYCQTKRLRLTTGVAVNTPVVKPIETDEGFSQKNVLSGLTLGLAYNLILKKHLGISTGVHFTRKRYQIQLEAVQSYEAMNGSLAELRVDLKTNINYNVFELPLTLFYLHDLSHSLSFFSFAAGGSLDWIRESGIAHHTNLFLYNPQGIHQNFSVISKDNFAFNSRLRYSLLMSASYHFLLAQKRWVGLEISYHFSPVYLVTFHLSHNINGEMYEASYQLERQDYVRILISYSLNKVIVPSKQSTR